MSRASGGAASPSAATASDYALPVRRSLLRPVLLLGVPRWLFGAGLLVALLLGPVLKLWWWLVALPIARLWVARVFARDAHSLSVWWQSRGEKNLEV